MTRLMSLIQLDFIAQWRNRFYAIGIVMAIIIGVSLRAFFSPEDLTRALPMMFLFAIGGSTMLYVAGLMIFEKDEGTLFALIVSPMRRPEYMLSKIITLSILATLETAIALVIAVGIGGYSLPLVLIGAILMAVMLTLTGIILVVRFDTLTDFLFPVLLIAMVLQMPFIYFLGLWENPLIWIVPTTAPTMLMWGGWHSLEPIELIYGFAYSIITIIVLYRWSLLAFNTHIVMKVRG